MMASGLWTYTPIMIPNPNLGLVNRGMAAYNGKLYMGMLDAHLVAIDAKTGKAAWNVDTVPEESRPGRDAQELFDHHGAASREGSGVRRWFRWRVRACVASLLPTTPKPERKCGASGLFPAIRRSLITPSRWSAREGREDLAWSAIATTGSRAVAAPSGMLRCMTPLRICCISAPATARRGIARCATASDGDNLLRGFHRRGEARYR